MEKYSGVPKNEDFELIREYAILSNLFTMIQKSISDLTFMRNLLEKAYTMSAKFIEARVLEDTKAVRMELKTRGVKIHLEQNEDFVIYYHFTCRGYNDKFGVTRDVMKTEISMRLGKYTAEVGQIFKESRQHVR